MHLIPFYSWAYKLTREKKAPEKIAPKNAEMGSRVVYGSFSEKNWRNNNGTVKIQEGVATTPPPPSVNGGIRVPF